MGLNGLVIGFVVLILLTALRGRDRGLYGILYGIMTWAMVIILLPTATVRVSDKLGEHEEVRAKVEEAVDPYVDVIAVGFISDKISGMVAESGLLNDSLKGIEGSEELLKEYEKMALGEELDADKVKDMIFGEGSGTGTEALGEELDADKLKDMVFGEGSGTEKEAFGDGDKQDSGEASDAEKGVLGEGDGVKLPSIVRDQAKAIIVDYVIYLISVVIGYILIKLLAAFAGMFIKSFLSDHKRSDIDNLGTLWGFAEGVLYVFVALLLVSAVAQTGFGKLMVAMVTQNNILKYMYENNVLRFVLENMPKI
ncbi:hypothetical protein [Butyrivibrio sp. XPD2002]|uniref:hypothetical protein n=1 Tax=Butyrivibrio sp. XPD2002 TaxID=1280665 RepID=UPI0004126EBC|nr:hypothetical protein [Butyrivibrio sp. XPD2002]